MLKPLGVCSNIFVVFFVVFVRMMVEPGLMIMFLVEYLLLMENLFKASVKN